LYRVDVRGLLAVETGVLIRPDKMKINKTCCLGLVLALLVLNSCTVRHNPSATQNFPPQTAAPELQTNRRTLRIPAADARFRYEGRFHFSDSNAPVIVWQASRISLDFKGDTLGLLFDDAKGQCFFNAQVDGSNTVVEVREGKPVTPATLAGFGTGRHHLVLFKRSEADAGTVHFRGVGLTGDAKAWAPPPPAYRLRMEFFGDSITVGACNEDGDTDQWDNRRTHNAALSFAALTAAALSADYRNIAVSGMGIATGWVTPKAGEVWDKIYPNPASPRADLTQWVPQVVFVNFGENDDSYPRAHGQPFPEGYTDGYIALVRAIRAAYPSAHIVLLRGGMYGGAQSEPLRQAWESAVTQLEAADPAVSHFIFTHWTQNHPRVADDRAMADELIAWLKQQSFVQACR
jgi:lysophospholipase L1-like esterase